MIDWLVTNALAALALAAIAGVFIWTFRPAPAVRHALWLVVVLKLVAPGGPTVALPVSVDEPRAEPRPIALCPPPEEFIVEEEIFTVVVDQKPGQTFEEAACIAMRCAAKDDATDARAEPVLAPIPACEPPPPPPFDYRPWLLGLWIAGAVYVGWRQLRETLRFARFARNAKPASNHLVAEVAAVANSLGVGVPAVRVLAGLTSPVMWCLSRPVLLWPAGLECRLKGEGRRAVIAHELAHLRRRDHWVRRLEMVAAVLHWWNPLFWVARQKMRADAELACDAWATGQADRRAYAEALLEVCSFNPRRRPAPAVGVFGEGRRAMQERLTMIMHDRVPCRLAFGAKLVVALMAIAAIPAWTLGQSKPVVVDDIVIEIVDTTEGDDDDATSKAIEAQIKALSQKLEALKASKKAQVEKAVTEKVKEAQDKVNVKLKELKLRAEQDVLLPKTTAVTKEVKVLVSGKDGVKVIGADGKEIKDAKVIIGGAGEGGAPMMIKPLTVRGVAADPTRVELKIANPDGKPAAIRVPMELPTVSKTAPATSFAWTTTGPSGSNAITLSRATYKLNKDQAAALGTLLGSIKATVMETKVDGESLTVTTTPDAQQTIGQIVRLIQGQGGAARYEYRIAPGAAHPAQGVLTPYTPATPAVPAAPARPPASAKPAPVKPVSGQGEGPEKIDVKVILDQLKPVTGVKLESSDLDMAKLQELLKTLKPATRTIRPGTEKKPTGDKE